MITYGCLTNLDNLYLARSPPVFVTVCNILLQGVDFMREAMNRRKDSSIFRRTAVQTKKINLGVSMMRGGIRF